MTPELTQDYSERASLTAIRMIFSVLGYILGAATTTVIAGLFGSLMGFNPQQSWSGTGLFFGLLAALAVLSTAFSVREKPAAAVEISKMAPVRAVLTTFRNRPFTQLMIAFFISSFSFTLLTALVPYFIIYQLGMPEAVPIVLLAMLLSIMIFIIPAKRISDRINKGPAYALGLLLASLAIISSFFLPQGPTPLIYVIAILAGAGFSAQWVFPWSMVPDVVEYDELATGERREGIYFGLWAFLTKFTGALGVAVSGWSLAWFGYIPNVAQSEQALLGIRLFFSLIPALALLVSLPLLIWYPVTRQSHARVLAELEEKRQIANQADAATPEIAQP